MKKLYVLKNTFTDEQVDRLRAAAPEVEIKVAAGSEFDTWKDADGLIGKFPPKQMANCPNLSWFQVTSSGADPYVNAGVPEQVTFTTATGAYGIGIAEYMVAMLMNMMKKIPAYLEDQKKAIWTDEGAVVSPMGKRVLVVGTGNLGTEFAKRMRAFGSTLIGVRRRADIALPDFDETKGMDSLEEEVAKADVIALCLPGTGKTKYLFDEEMLMKCKEGAYLMNVGRGNVIPQKVMYNRAVTDHFAGIWLDVVESEPVPEGDDLYRVPNLLLTPHITGGLHLDITINQVFDITLHNMKAWLGDGEYMSVLDCKSGYCK